MQFGEMILDYRRKNGISQREFAQSVGISASYVCILERRTKGLIRPSPKVVERCSEVMGVSLGCLYSVLYEDLNVDPLIHQIVNRLDQLEKWQLSIIAELIDDYLSVKS